MPQIVLSAKKPFQISASKQSLTIGKWMTSHLTAGKKPFYAETLANQDKKLKASMAEANKAKKKFGNTHLTAMRADMEVYRQAMNYSDTYWKHCREKSLTDTKNTKKYKQAMKQAEKDFNYFSRGYETLKSTLNNKGSSDPQYN